MGKAKKIVNSILKTGLSLEDIASRIRVNYFTVYRWARGLTSPQRPRLEALEKLLARRKK